MREPSFDRASHRAAWLWDRLIQAHRMTGEQMEYLRCYPEMEPYSWRSVNALLEIKWGMQYRQIRDCLMEAKNNPGPA